MKRQQRGNDIVGDGKDFGQLPEPMIAIIRRHETRCDVNMLSALKTATKAGIGVSTLWRDLKDGRFVPPIQISERRVAWIESEVDALLDAKRLMSRSDINVDIRQFIHALVGKAEVAE